MPFLIAVAFVAQATTIATIKPVRGTDRLPHDPDDPAIWINRTDPAKSLVFDTVKVSAPGGALALFGTTGYREARASASIRSRTEKGISSRSTSCRTTPLGPDFPDGMMIAMNRGSRNVLMFRWRDIAPLAAPAR